LAHRPFVVDQHAAGRWIVNGKGQTLVAILASDSGARARAASAVKVMTLNISYR
jgi:hypothetical protein